MPPDSSLQAAAANYLATEGPQEKAGAYDNLLWRISTASPEELQEFAAQIWDEPYFSLPVPLLVTVWRLVGLESPDDPDMMRNAIGGIAHHSNPVEEANATAGIRRLLNKHEHSQF
jgi:hypothetical protein